MAKAKTANKTAMLRQPGGRGALLAGGMPGNAGGGRPKEALRAKCREALEGRDETEEHGVEFVARVMRGTETEDVVVTVGGGKDATTRVAQVRPKLRDRLYAFELLSERGYGKPPQELQVEDAKARPTGDALIARVLELLPRVVAMLPVDRKEIARLFAERQQIEVLVQGREVKEGGRGNGDRA